MNNDVREYNCPSCYSKNINTHDRSICEKCLFVYGTVTVDGEPIEFFISKITNEIIAHINGMVTRETECIVNGVSCSAIKSLDGKKILIVSTIPISGILKKRRSSL